MPARAIKKPPPWTPTRRFITPEGVDLRLELGTAGARAGAFMLDAMLQVLVLIALTIAVAFSIGFGGLGGAGPLAVIWLLGFFVLRNGWFIAFEIGGRGATPGKRALGLRVIARDSARLTGGAVIARNALREVELFLPLSFLAAQASQGRADAFLTIFALAWSGIFLFFPLFNRDRMRVGDLLAGTWVVVTQRAKLARSLAPARAEAAGRVFSDAALGLYGIYELQTLEGIIRAARPQAVSLVAQTVRAKAGIAEDGDDLGFLTDYYVQLCAKLERGVMMGTRRENKFDAATRRR